jgi:hypothetical protein
LASTIMNLRSFLLLVCATFGLLGRIPAQFGIVTADYHGVTATQHQNQYTLLQGQGYRPISLAVAGGLANARYSAVWQRIGGPAWVAAHGMTYAQYQTQAGTWAGQGYRAKLVAASGVGAGVVFAAMWVQDGVTVHHQQALATSSLDGAIATQRSQGRRLTSAAAYNRNGIDYHAVVFEPDASGIAWGGWGGDDGVVFSAKFNEHSRGGERPSLVSLSDSQRYTHVWRDDRIGNNFTTLWTSDTRNFGLLSGAVRWDFPPLGPLPRLHLQATALDPNLLFPMPLPVTPVETVTRTP